MQSRNNTAQSKTQWYIENYSKGFVAKRSEELLGSKLPNAAKDIIAAQCLGVDLDKLNNIPSAQEKLRYLNYRKNKVVLLELSKTRVADFPEYIKNNSLHALKGLIEQSFNYLTQSSLLKVNHQTSGFNRGFDEFFYRSHAQKKNQNAMDQSLFITGDKEYGIEPGFMATTVQDIIETVVRLYGDQASEFIDNHNADLRSLEQAIKAYLPNYQFKLDYRETFYGYTINEEDARRTNTVKHLSKQNLILGKMAARATVWGKTTSSEDLNLGALMESLGTDIAGMAMNIHQQTLVQGKYSSSNKLKMLIKGKWLTNAEEFGKGLAGGLKDSDNYPGRKLLNPQGIHSLTDDRINDEGIVLPLLLFLGDRDKVGSKGQNLLVTKTSEDPKTGRSAYQILGIDYGHVLEDKPILDRVLSSGRILPIHKEKYKNYSMLSDIPFSEFIKGVQLLKYMNSKTIDTTQKQKLKDWYKDPVFNQKLDTLEVSALDTLLQDYINQLEKIAKLDKENARECQQHIQHFRKLQTTVPALLDQWLDKFKNYLDYPPQALDLAANLEKLVAAFEGKTSLVSPNGKHGLKHLRIIDALYTKPEDCKKADRLWKIETKQEQYYLSMTIENQQSLAETERLIQQWLGNDSQIKLSQKGNALQLQFPKNALAKVYESLSEDKIKQTFHAQEYQMIQTGYAEIALQDLVEAKWYSEHQMAITLKWANCGNYQLSFAIENANLKEVLRNVFKESLITNLPYLILECTPQNLKEVYQKLLQVQSNYDALQTLKTNKEKLKNEILSLNQNHLFQLKMLEINDEMFELPIDGITPLLASQLTTELFWQEEGQGIKVYGEYSTFDTKALTQLVTNASIVMASEKQQQLKEEEAIRQMVANSVAKAKLNFFKPGDNSSDAQQKINLTCLNK